MTDEERKQFINEYCRNVGNIKIKCDDCKFVEDCVDYGWDGCRKFTPTRKKRHTQETAKLKPCPFCGSEPVYVADGKVICICGAMMQSFNDWKPFTTQEAVDRWNKRVRWQNDGLWK